MFSRTPVSIARLGCRFFSSQRIIPAGMVSLGAYLPAKKIPESRVQDFTAFLRKHTLLPSEYIDDIAGNGCLPGRIETNYEGWESQPWFQAWLDNMPPKHVHNPFRGAEERRKVPLDPHSVKHTLHPYPMLSSDAETLACAMAMFNADIDPKSVDLVLTHSTVPDRYLPGNAALVQHKLKLKSISACNIDTACSSFLSMLDMATAQIQLGRYKNVLIVSSGINSRRFDRSNFYNVESGDGSAAALISEVDEEYGYLASHSISDGSKHAAVIIVKRRPELFAYTRGMPTGESEYLTFEDWPILKETAQDTPLIIAEAVKKCLMKANCSISDVDFFVSHHPTFGASQAWRDMLGLPKKKVYESFKKYGNILGASVAVNAAEAIGKSLITADDRLLMASPGAGQSIYASLHRITPRLVANTMTLMHEEDKAFSEEEYFQAEDSILEDPLKNICEK